MNVVEFASPVVLAMDIIEWPGWMQALVLLWLASFGASLGSFMNVVIYRLPAGLSIVRPRSRCPKCLHPIRGIDNIPVLSWLILRGRCRDCATRISARYPTVEATAAIIALAVALAELFPLDWLPLAWQPLGREPLTGAGAWAGYCCHLLVLLTLLSGALIEFDRHVPPVSLFVPACLLGLLAAIAWPQTGNLFPVGPQRDVPLGIAGLVAGLFGAGLGSFLGRFVPADPTATRRRLGYALAFAAVGLAWGPSVALAAGLAAAGALGAERFTGKVKVPPLGAAMVVSLALSVAARWWNGM